MIIQTADPRPNALPATEDEHARENTDPATHRRSAVCVGALFLMATAAFFASDSIMTSLLDGPDYLVEVAANSKLVVTSSLLALIEGIGVVAIGVLMYPILQRHNPLLALGYISFRIGELAAIIMLALTSLMLLTVAQDTKAAGDTAETLGRLLTGTYDWLLPIVYLFSCAAGIMLSAALYATGLVPRWLSLLGLVGYPALMFTAALHMLGYIDMVNGTGLVGLIPGGVFELVLPLWLISKGFNTRTINSTGTAASSTSV